MPTVRAALEALETGLFVDRHAESEAFRSWLSADSPYPRILQVIGHAGVGKSALLRHFARQAAALGCELIVQVDGETTAPTADEFAKAVTGNGLVDPATFLGDRPALLMIDGMDELAPLTRWLTTELIPSLDPNVRVLVAGRQPVGPMWTRWLHAIKTIQLDSLPRNEAAVYLERRGVSPDVADEILEAAGGYPLGLTLAADLALQRRVTRFKKAPEWHLTLAGLVEELVKDAPTLRSLLEAAAVVRQFDEPTLAATAGLEEASQAFAELCAVSFVRPAQHGLTLHDDVRRVVIEELQWRNPDRLAQLRRHARAYYRDRIRERRPGEEWLVPERMYLWEHSVHAMYFPSGEASTMWVEAGGPGDIDELLALQDDFLAMLKAGVALPALPPPEECSPEFLRAVVALPGTEVSIARSPDGESHGYSFIVPVSQALLGILPPDGAIAALIERGLPADIHRAIPPTWEGSQATYMSTDTVRGDRALEAFGALAADTFRAALRGGIFLGCTGSDAGAQAAVAIGMTRIPGVGTASLPPASALDGFALDIGRIGPDAWLEAVTSGTPVPPTLSAEDLEKELHQVLVHWDDDSRLAQSPLAQVAALLATGEGASPAESLRGIVRVALAEVRALGTDEAELACRAIELAYFEHQLAHEAIAERLNLSRSSFYRHLHRAEREIAARLGAPARS